MTDKAIRVLVWSELTEPKNVYPNGINGAIAEHLKTVPGLEVRTASIIDLEQGLSEDMLAQTDVLIWWGHVKHRDVTDANAARVVQHVLIRGMGFIALHSAIHAKPFVSLMGTSGNIGGWREDGKPEKVWVIEPHHPIAKGLDNMFVIPQEEMYSERFDVPPPDELVFISSFAEGEVFRSGCCWRRGNGRVFYFRPGHETHPVYFDPNVRRAISNAVFWCAGREVTA